MSRSHSITDCLHGSYFNSVCSPIYSDIWKAEPSYVPGVMLGVGDPLMGRTNTPLLLGLAVQEGRWITDREIDRFLTVS